MKKKDLTKAKILKLVDKSDSFLVVFMTNNGNEVHYLDYNVSKADIITGCEVVKAKVLKKVVK